MPVRALTPMEDDAELNNQRNLLETGSSAVPQLKDPQIYESQRIFWALRMGQDLVLDSMTLSRHYTNNISLPPTLHPQKCPVMTC